MATEHDTPPPHGPRTPKPLREPTAARDPVPPELADARSTPPLERSPRRRSYAVATGVVGIVVAAIVLFLILGTTIDDTDPAAPPASTEPSAPPDAPAAPAVDGTVPAD